MWYFVGLLFASEARTTAPFKPKVGVAQKRLQLKRPQQPATVRRPLPQATKTNLYDEHWAAKQERGIGLIYT